MTAKGGDKGGHQRQWPGIGQQVFGPLRTAPSRGRGENL